MRRSPAPDGRVGPRRRAVCLLAVAGIAAGCASLGTRVQAPPPAGRPASGSPASAPGSSAAGSAAAAGLPRREPYLRVGLAVGLDSVVLSSRDGLRVRDLATGRALPFATGRWIVDRVEGGLQARPLGRGAAGRSTDPGSPAGPGPGAAGPGVASAAPRQDVLFEAGADSGTVRADGREYRGGIEVLALGHRGLVLINRVRLEDYLLGVVPLEMGRRKADEVQAVEAQAVAARTYALANLGRRDSLGFDVFGDVQDQVYGGIEAEQEQATRAVRATRGQVLTWQDRPIRAYYHADGGGRTARVDEVWNLPDAPYLQSIADTAPDGEDWGASDPDHLWEVRWSAAQLSGALASGLSSYYGSAVRKPGRVTGIRVTARTASGRAERLEIRTAGGRYLVERNDIRFVLLQPDGKVLRSTLFRIASGPGADGGRLTVDGRGNGHGVGMCQWGAIGRARAGQSYEQILAAYYPGAELRNAY